MTANLPLIAPQNVNLLQIIKKVQAFQNKSTVFAEIICFIHIFTSSNELNLHHAHRRPAQHGSKIYFQSAPDVKAANKFLFDLFTQIYPRKILLIVVKQNLLQFNNTSCLEWDFLWDDTTFTHSGPGTVPKSERNTGNCPSPKFSKTCLVINKTSFNHFPPPENIFWLRPCLRYRYSTAVVSVLSS